MQNKTANQSDWKNRMGIGLMILIFSAISVLSIHPYKPVNAEKLVFIKTSVDNSLYSDDYLLREKQYYYTCFDKIFAATVRTFGIDIPVLLFVSYSVSICATFLGIYLIAVRLFGKTEVGMLSLFFFLFANKASLPGVSVLGTVFTERTAALPMLLFAMYFFLQKKYLHSYLLQGLAFLLHPLSASYVVAMLFVSSVFNIRQTGIRTFLMCLGLFLILISPMLIWKLLNSPGTLNMLHADSEWLELLRLRSAHHIFPFSWDGKDFLREGILLLTFLITWKYKPAPDHQRVILCSAVTIFLMWIAGTIFTEFLPLPIVIQFQLFRSSSWLIYFTVIYFANYFLRSMREEKNIFARLMIVFVSIGIFYGPSHRWLYNYMTFSVISGLLICCDFPHRRNISLTQFGAGLTTVTLVLGSAYLIRDGFDFSRYDGQREKEWVSVQIWARTHTDPEDMFIVPPNISGFRDESERAIYGDWKDGTQMFFNPAFGYEWIRRMKALGYREDMPVRSFENLDKLGEGFEDLSESDFLRIGDEIRADDREIFLVMTRERGSLNFPELYRNEKFTVYKVSHSVIPAD